MSRYNVGDEYLPADDLNTMWDGATTYNFQKFESFENLDEVSVGGVKAVKFIDTNEVDFNIWGIVKLDLRRFKLNEPIGFTIKYIPETSEASETNIKFDFEWSIGRNTSPITTTGSETITNATLDNTQIYEKALSFTITPAGATNNDYLIIKMSRDNSVVDNAGAIDLISFNAIQ